MASTGCASKGHAQRKPRLPKNPTLKEMPALASRSCPSCSFSIRQHEDWQSKSLRPPRHESKYRCSSLQLHTPLSFSFPDRADRMYNRGRIVRHTANAAANILDNKLLRDWPLILRREYPVPLRLMAAHRGKMERTKVMPGGVTSICRRCVFAASSSLPRIQTSANSTEYSEDRIAAMF